MQHAECQIKVKLLIEHLYITSGAYAAILSPVYLQIQQANTFSVPLHQDFLISVSDSLENFEILLFTVSKQNIEIPGDAIVNRENLLFLKN